MPDSPAGSHLLRCRCRVDARGGGVGDVRNVGQGLQLHRARRHLLQPRAL